jgi:hypothetical protein|tara:strand:- start:391 stop:1101 length:711 start_codon:yes stop_codon:yes gene_type:complete
MLITDKFVFIHLFRTGGTSINNSFKGKMVGYHRPRSLIPKEYTSLPIVGNIRNPFDWYVDIYYHALNFHYPMKTSTFLNFILDFNKYSFKESIKRLLDTSWMTSQDKEKSLSHFVDSYNWNIKLTDNLRKTEFQSYLDSNIGYLSWLFNYMYEDKGSSDGVTYCRLEHLEKDWSSFLGKDISYPKLNALSGVNSIFGQIKEPRQKNYMSYYDDDLIDLIMDKDRNYIKKFNYNKIK